MGEAQRGIATMVTPIPPTRYTPTAGPSHLYIYAQTACTRVSPPVILAKQLHAYCVQV